MSIDHTRQQDHVGKAAGQMHAPHMHHAVHTGHPKHKAHGMDVEHARHEEFDRHRGHTVADFRRRFWISLILTVPILFLSPMIQEFLGLSQILRFPGDLYLLFISASAVFVYGGYPFLIGLSRELRQKLPGMMTLIGLAISVAYVYSSAVVFGLSGKIFYWELATLIDIMLLGHWIEMKSIMGASKALEKLAALLPSTAHKIMANGLVQDVPLSELVHGDRVLVKPGEKIPADGEVVDGLTSVNEAMITGESAPATKKLGDQVIGGSINGEGSIQVEIRKTGEESFLSQVVSLVKQAQASKSKTQDLANRAALWLTIVAITAGTITLVAWLIFGNQDLAFALTRAVTVMVIACPHALGLAIPLVVAVSTSISATSGLLIRNRTAFERARNIQAVIFDKTGTLTKGEFGVTDVESLDKNLSNEQILRYAASVEASSEHPIAKGIVASSKDTFEVRDFRAITGKGAEGKVDGKNVKVVSPGYLRENRIKVNHARVDELSVGGKTVVFVMIDGEVKGVIALADMIREESRNAIAMLKEMGIRPMMLTGDNEKVARWVADQIGIEEYFAGVLPQHKVDKVKEVQARGLIVAMTGDGVNDAPALAQADVAIAIGAGTDVAIETADIILVRSNPLDVVSVIGLAKATYRKMAQNLAWATGYNAFAIPLAAGVFYGYGILLSPALGAVLMSLSTVIVAINARFLKMK